MDPLINIQFVFSLLVFSSTRLAVVFLVAPFFGEQFITGLARNLVILSLAAMVIPITLAQYPSEHLAIPEFVAILIKEAVIGLILGFIIAIPFFIVENMGSFIDSQRGSNIAQILDPSSGESVSVLGILFLKVVVLLFFVSGSFLLFLKFFYSTYILWPIFSFFPKFNDAFPTYLLNTMDQLMTQTFLLAAPVTIVLFLSEFGLGLMNRFAPQLNVFSLSLPIKSGLAMFMFFIYTSTLFALMKVQFSDVMDLLNAFTKIIS